ncbi:hypothetical protein BJY52DRAFT_1227669 [Lactarius psammicola]|nr:hypothetical protein BJY52DRAFT_1227669 [Lactarius psammicola]
MGNTQGTGGWLFRSLPDYIPHEVWACPAPACRAVALVLPMIAVVVRNPTERAALSPTNTLTQRTEGEEPERETTAQRPQYQPSLRGGIIHSNHGRTTRISVPDAICGTNTRNYEPGTYLDDDPLAKRVREATEDASLYHREASRCRGIYRVSVSGAPATILQLRNERRNHQMTYILALLCQKKPLPRLQVPRVFYCVVYRHRTTVDWGTSLRVRIRDARLVVALCPAITISPDLLQPILLPLEVLTDDTKRNNHHHIGSAMVVVLLERPRGQIGKRVTRRDCANASPVPACMSLARNPNLHGGDACLLVLRLVHAGLDLRVARAMW